MTFEADAAVVGAGPAGASAALHLAARGLSVVLVDQARFPRPKACGEGIMPGGLPVLAELGLLEPVEKEGRRFFGVRFTSERGVSAEGRFPGGRHGVVFPRERLDSLLLDKAKASPRIRVLEGWRATRVLPGGVEGPEGKILAPRLVLADGARSLGAERRMPKTPRFGLRAHFDGVEGLGDLVEVFLLPGSEVYVAPHAGGRALVAVLTEGKALNPGAYLEAVASCAPLKERMKKAVQVSAVMGAGPLGGWARRVEGPGRVLVGDAAGSLDPITGEGIAVALRCGALAASRLYGLRRRRLMLGKRLLEGFVLGLARRPAAAELALAALRRCPSAFSALLCGC